MRNYDEHKKILELWDQGFNKLQIANVTGIPRGTVRRCIERYGSVAGLEEANSARLSEEQYSIARTILQLWELGKSKQEIIKTTSISKYWVHLFIDRYRSLAGLEDAQNDPDTDISNKSDRRRKYTRKERKNSDDELIKAVNQSYSIRQVLQVLELKPAGGNYKTIKQRIDELGLDTSHFKGRGWAKSETLYYRTRRPLEEILVQDSNYGTTSSLKKRLLAEGIFEHICAGCGLEIWREQPIPLELDHINGDNRDNRLENLRLLCPNCHALTETYRGKNINLNKESQIL